MVVAADERTEAQRAAALDALRPERFGFRRDGRGWVRGGGDGLSVVVAPLSWEHAQAATYDVVGGERIGTDALNLLVELQRRTWGMDAEDLVPVNVLAVAAETGGSVLVAYDPAVGFNGDGWLGFAIGFGSRTGTLVSHMLGVREEARGAHDIGWALKVIQGYDALVTGHDEATWTFDPMRGANARLNIEKLGATVELLTLDKYGIIRSTLYGEGVPSDRFTARWRLTQPRTWERLAAVLEGRYRGQGPADVAALPEVTVESAARIAASGPPRVRYRIPGDIDRLQHQHAGEAARWRREMREVLPGLLRTKVVKAGDAGGDPGAVRVRDVAGAYVIDGFATGLDEAGERVNFYVLRRMEGEDDGG